MVYTVEFTPEALELLKLKDQPHAKGFGAPRP